MRRACYTFNIFGIVFHLYFCEKERLLMGLIIVNIFSKAHIIARLQFQTFKWLWTACLCPILHNYHVLNGFIKKHTFLTLPFMIMAP